MAGTNGATVPNDTGVSEDLSNEAIDAATEEPTPEGRAQTLYRDTVEMKGHMQAQRDMISGLNSKLVDAERRLAKQDEAMNELLERSRGAEERGFAYEQDAAYARMRKAASE